MITERLRNNTISVQEGKARIDQVLGNYGDDEVVIEQPSIKLSLKCPVSLTKMKKPVKGDGCKHIDVSKKHIQLFLKKKNVTVVL